MIVSASYRTDIPAFYGPWFLARLEAGFCRVANPYGGPPSTVALTADAVDGFVFWTRNPWPFQPALAEVARRGFPFVVQATVMGYPRAIDLSVIEAERAVAAIRAVRDAYGPRAAVWRYDPIVVSDLTPPDWHRRTFAALAGALRGAVDEVAVSFVQVYRKTARNMDAAARAARFGWRDPDDGEKAALLADLAAIAADAGLRLTLCGQPHLLGLPGVAEAACIDAGRLSDVAGRAIAAAAKPHRKTCACAASRDIGAYDTCPHGCAYCYAVSSRDRAKSAHASHDPGTEMLGT